jgi:hypothetical protein
MKTILTSSTIVAMFGGSVFAAAFLGSLLPLTAADAAAPAPATVRDRLWVWAVDASFDWPARFLG